MKTFVLTLFLVMLSTTFLTSSMMTRVYVDEKPIFDAGRPVELSQLYEESTNPTKLKAMLKGSIYETGEQMTVFGACFDGYGYLINDENVTATFSSWYANGTQWEVDQPMMSVNDSFGNKTGRFNYQVNMPSVMGTYLTEITCHYLGDIANAFGEWQNPDWVKRIKDTQDSLFGFQNITIDQYNNMTTLINEFRDGMSNNFTDVISAINNINISSSTVILEQQIKDVYNMVHAIDTSFWAVDNSSPFYSYPGGIQFSAIDAASPSNIFVAATDGSAFYYDGELWSMLMNTSSEEWYDISVLPADIPYAWLAGLNGYSINGGASQYISGSVPYISVRLFQRTVSEDFRGYLVENNTGVVWYTDDSGLTFSNPVNFTNGADVGGKISEVLWFDSEANYRMLMTSGKNQAIYYDGSTYSEISLDSDIVLTDVSLIRNNNGYVIGQNTTSGSGILYQFDGTSLNRVYEVGDVEFTGLGVASDMDIWISTSDPSSFYHYDGTVWKFSHYPYSGAISINFGGGNFTLPNLMDLTLFDAKNAWAVGSDGLVMRIYGSMDTRFDDLVDRIDNMIVDSFDNQTYTLVQGVANNLTILGQQVYANISELKEIVLYMNTSIMNDIDVVEGEILAMNETINIKLDYLLQNMTYMQLYLNTTLYPLLDATYQNTVQILIDLGILKAQMNQSIEMINQTLNIANETKAGVDELVAKSNRIRAWVTV